MGLRDEIGGRKVVGGGKIIGSSNSFVIHPFNEFSGYKMLVSIFSKNDQIYVNNKIRVVEGSEYECHMEITLNWAHVSFQPTANPGVSFSHLASEQFYLAYVLQVIGEPNNFVTNFDYLTLSGPLS